MMDSLDLALPSAKAARQAAAAAVKKQEGAKAAAAQAASQAASGAAGESTAPAAKAKPKKLTYNEQRELDAMEKNIAAAEARVAKAEAAVSDPAVIGDHVKMAAACKELETAHAQVETLFARWQELESRTK
jgi:ATP-binding cassette subfamily F protein uup